MFVILTVLHYSTGRVSLAPGCIPWTISTKTKWKVIVLTSKQNVYHQFIFVYASWFFVIRWQPQFYSIRLQFTLDLDKNIFYFKRRSHCRQRTDYWLAFLVDKSIWLVDRSKTNTISWRLVDYDVNRLCLAAVSVSDLSICS